ncbi:MAG: 30S ribosomal protein S7 [Bacteroidota bacterium]
MARTLTPKKTFLPDPRYNSEEVTRLINYVMQDGKKEKAMRIVYESFAIIKEKSGKEPLEIFARAKDHVTPHVEVRSRRIGGANLPIPVEVRTPRKFQLFLTWILEAAKKRSERKMTERLANELIAAANQEGQAFKRKENMDKSVHAQRAYAHLK